ncbi:MAG: hypothetical protein ACI8R4_001729 [Paracoccaceae bacterium]|jgi:hypothetical protein
MIGDNLHRRAQNGRELAQIGRANRPGLVRASAWGSLIGEHGGDFPASCSNLLFRTLSLIGQVGATRADLSEFFSQIRGLPHRRGVADGRFRRDFVLRTPHCAGFVPPSVTKPKKGWAGCEQHRYLQHLRCARALRPVATQRANRRFMARGRACLVRLSSMATRFLGPQSAPGATCFIASKTPASADRLTGTPYHRPLNGSLNITRNAAADHLVRGGALRFRTLQTKDTLCSPRS